MKTKIMKRRITYMLVAALTAGTAGAQDTYDAANFAGKDLNGTARYIGMGGALGALGGDLTVMGTNPAGTAIFRRNEVAFSASGIFTDEKGQLGHDSHRASLDQAGVIFTLDQEGSGYSGLQYINFGVNYTKSRNHLGNIGVGIGNLGGIFSQTHQIADLANSEYAADVSSELIQQGDFFNTQYWGMLSYLSAPDYDQAGKLNKDGIIFDNYDSNTGDFLGFEGIGAKSAEYSRATYGSTSQADINLSFNVSDKYFWGISLGVYDINYSRESYYSETGIDNRSYAFRNSYETNGEGFDLKLGMICRPVDDSPFRFGIAIHTPTWYNLEDQNSSTIFYQGNYVASEATDPYEYTYRTPWKFGLSLGHTIGKTVALGAEYEFADFSTCHYDVRGGDYNTSNKDYYRAINDFMKDNLRAQHTLKLGVEWKPATNFAIRAGYNLVTSPYKSSAFSTLPFGGNRTETDFCNWGNINRYTLGVGYRYKGGYFDIAYQYQAQKGDFYAFDDQDLAPTQIKNDRMQVLATLGFRF